MKTTPFLLLLLLVGCGPHDVSKFTENPPAPQLAENWRTHQMSDISATINAPKDWITPQEAMHIVDLGSVGGEGQAQISDEQMKNDLKLPDEMIKQNNEAAKLPDGTSLLLSKRGIVGETSTITQIELKHKKVQGGTTVKAAADEVAGNYLGSAKRSTVQLPVGSAEMVTMTTKTRDGETGHHIQYVMVNNEDVYILSFQTEQQKEIIQDIAQQVAESFRLTK